MTRDELDRIERALRLKLPRFYRQFMLRFPVDQVYDHSPSGRRADAWEFTNRPARVIQLNRSVQRRGRTFDDAPWPEEFIVIGSRDIYNYYSLNPNVEGLVCEMRQDDDKFSEVADSLEEFAELIAGMRQKANRDEIAG